MSASKLGRLAGLAGLAAALLVATAAWAETRPPTTPAGRNAPPPKGLKTDTEIPDYNARAPAKGRGFYSLPEKDDEVLLLRSRRKGQ